MEKKILSLVVVSLVLVAGNAFGLTFWGDSFSGGGTTGGYYISPDAAYNSQPPQPPPIIEGPILLGPGGFGGVLTPNQAQPPQGPEQPGMGVLGITLDNSTAVNYITSLMANLPQDQQDLLKGVMDLINNTPGAKVKVDLPPPLKGQPGDENNLGVKFTVLTAEGEILADATINLKTPDAATVESIRKDFQAIWAEKDNATQQATDLKTLFTEKISKLSVEGSDTAITTQLDAAKDRAKIDGKIKDAYDYLVKNGLQTEADRLLQEMNNALTDAGAVSLRETYHNGKLVNADLDFINKAGDVRYQAGAHYGEDGKIISAGLGKWGNGVVEKVFVQSQGGLPEGITAEQAAKEFFAQQYGVTDPATQFGADIWQKLIDNWGKFTVSTYDQNTFDLTTKVTTGTAKLIFVYGDIRLELPPISYTRQPGQNGSGNR